MKIITEFIYDNKTYFTSKLDKKLKKLHITKDDIEIIREFEEIENNKAKQAEKNNQEIENNNLFYYLDPSTNYTYISISNDKTHFINAMWNEETKTGIKEWTIDFINRLILLDRKPTYPIK